MAKFVVMLKDKTTVQVHAPSEQAAKDHATKVSASPAVSAKKLKD